MPSTIHTPYASVGLVDQYGRPYGPTNAVPVVLVPGMGGPRKMLGTVGTRHIVDLFTGVSLAAAFSMVNGTINYGTAFPVEDYTELLIYMTYIAGASTSFTTAGLAYTLQGVDMINNLYHTLPTTSFNPGTLTQFSAAAASTSVNAVTASNFGDMVRIGVSVTTTVAIPTGSSLTVYVKGKA